MDRMVLLTSYDIHYVLFYSFSFSYIAYSSLFLHTEPPISRMGSYHITHLPILFLQPGVFFACPNYGMSVSIPGIDSAFPFHFLLALFSYFLSIHISNILCWKTLGCAWGARVGTNLKCMLCMRETTSVQGRPRAKQ